MPMQKISASEVNLGLKNRLSKVLTRPLKLAGFFNLVVYTQRRVPDTEIRYGYQKEVTQKSFEAQDR
jgi:hypothetical protein